MDAANSSALVSPADRDLMRRLTIVLALLLALTGSMSWLWRFYGNKFYDLTGRADWIWATHRISRNVPVVFCAVRDFDLPANRLWTRVKLAADPQYTFFFNGQAVAWHRAGATPRLDIYDVSKLAHTGRNRMVVAVRSTNGVGGLLAAIDTGPEAENVVVTDRGWKIFRTWTDDLPLRDSGRWESPMIFGEPPVGPWDYLGAQPGGFGVPPRRILQPRSTTRFIGRLPVVKITEGVAVAVEERSRATAYDFGPTHGRVRLTLIGNQPVPPLVRFRLANIPEELDILAPATAAVAFGSGEQSVTDPDVHSFRYVIVYGARASAEVAQ